MFYSRSFLVLLMSAVFLAVGCGNEKQSGSPSNVLSADQQRPAPSSNAKFNMIVSRFKWKEANRRYEDKALVVSEVLLSESVDDINSLVNYFNIGFNLSCDECFRNLLVKMNAEDTEFEYKRESDGVVSWLTKRKKSS